MKTKYLWISIIAMLIINLVPGSLNAAVGGMIIGGCIYQGHGTVTYTMDALGEPVGSWSTTFAPSALTPPISNASVMVQNQHNGGAVIGYGTTGLGADGNCWEATIPDDVDNATGAAGADGTPDAEDLVVMFSAKGYDLTSREFTWNESLGAFTHPKQGGGIAGQVDTPAGAEATGPQDAYLPALNNVDATGAGTKDTANLLHYVFYDNFTNGGDNGPVIDPGLNGVTVTVSDAAGNTWTQKTGELAFSQGGFVTKDGLPFLGSMAYGFVYFEGLPGGQNYEVISDPSTVTQADNPHIPLALTHTGAANCSLDRSVEGPYGYGNAATSCPWYQTSTEEGGHSWDVFLWPGDPGTEMGFYLTWHAYIEKLGNDAGGLNPTTNGTISGTLLDADGNDPEEPFPQIGGGRVPPTNARYEDGTPWDVNLNSGGWGGCVTQPGNICPPLGRDYIPNGRVGDAIVALYSTFGGVPKLVATTEATQPSLYNSPNGGEWSFTNVPPGSYEIFTFDKDLVNVPTVGTGVNVIPGNNLPISILNPRFKARGAGFVLNNGAPVDATVKVQYLGGATQNQVNTNPATGWFEVYNLPETGGLGKFYVDLQDGDPIRGKIISENFQRETPLGEEITNATHNAMSRSVQWWTLNYFVDLQVETIPAGVGNLLGVVFFDTLTTGSWVADGIWDEAAETSNGGETVELYETAAGACPDLTVASPPLPVATAITGETNGADAAIMGWVPFGTWPPNEIGGVFGDPVVCPTCSQTTGTPAPAHGFYEFRDVVPGAYCVRVAPQPGFKHSPDIADGLTLVTVTDGFNSRIDLGVTSTPTDPLGAPLASIPMAGLIEGGVFSGNGDLDPNPLSTMFDEAMNIVGSPVGVYDQFNYLLGVMYQTDAWCNTANNAVHVPGSYPTDPFACSSATDTLQPPEMDRYFAPGMFRYAGNDPNFTKDPTIALPDASGIVFAGNDKIRGFDPRFETMELGAGMVQGGFLLEFAWTPLTPIDGSVAADMCAIGVSGVTFNSEPYGGNVTITVSDGFMSIVGARVSGSVDGQGGEDCFTNNAGECTMSFEKFEGAGDSVIFTVDNIVAADPWYVYNPTPGGFLAGACQTSVTLYDPDFVPPPPPPAAACGDSIDNDGDGLIDFPADPGCFSATDNDEFDAPPPTYQCSDGIDNDGDGLIDFPADPGCFSATDQDETDIPPEPTFACSDTLDNDGDGLVDMLDPGCDTVSDDDETDPIYVCSDGLDNDGDTLFDFPADPGCASATDPDEFNAPLPVCSDFIDNDGDGLIDFPADPGCLSTTDVDEIDPPPPVYLCLDGLDNDGDGVTDFPDDPGCDSATDNDETDPPPVYACSDGLDNDGDGLFDLDDPGCTDATDNDEFNAPLAQCDDGIDNDGDTFIDLADPGCTDATDDDETNAVESPTSVHASSLTGTPKYKEGKLAAEVTVGIADDLGNDVDGALVTMIYTWDKEGVPTSKTFSCTTDASGTCTATTKYMENTSSVAISLDTVSAALVYHPQDNTVNPITVP